MNKVRPYLYLILICLTASTMNSKAQNPFDIINRETDRPILQNAERPNIPRSEETGMTPPIDPSQAQNGTDSIEVAIDGEPINPQNNDVQLKSEKPSFLEMQHRQALAANPFNVSHIPITRRKKSFVDESDSKSGQEIKKDTTQELNTDLVEASSTPPTVIGKSGQKTNKFVFWLFLLQLLLITSLMGINREFIRKIYRSISNDNFAKLVSRDYNGGYNALFAILYLLFFLSMSIFSYLVLRNFYGVDGFSMYLLILLSVVAVYVFRHIFQGFTAFVFPFGRSSSYYNFMIILFNSFLGLVLIPLNVIAAYTPSGIANFAIYLGIAAVLIMYLLRFLRGSLHAYTFVRNYLFHFFLYLCTCEFAPVFILVKFLSKSFIN